MCKPCKDAKVGCEFAASGRGRNAKKVPKAAAPAPITEEFLAELLQIFTAQVGAQRDIAMELRAARYQWEEEAAFLRWHIERIAGATEYQAGLDRTGEDRQDEYNRMRQTQAKMAITDRCGHRARAMYLPDDQAAMRVFAEDVSHQAYVAGVTQAIVDTDLYRGDTTSSSSSDSSEVPAPGGSGLGADEKEAIARGDVEMRLVDSEGLRPPEGGAVGAGAAGQIPKPVDEEAVEEGEEYTGKGKKPKRPRLTKGRKDGEE